MRALPLALSVAIVALAACRSDTPTSPDHRTNTLAAAASKSKKGSNSTSSVQWNREAIALFKLRGGSPSRANTYLALAQYRAVMAAADARHGKTRPSLAGAAAGASVVILKHFYPLDHDAIDEQLELQRAVPPVGPEHNLDFEDGEAIGRTVAAAVLAYAATDNYGLTVPVLPPGIVNPWTSSGAPIVRSGLGARPFFLTSGSELRPAAPPAPGSLLHESALAEVRSIALSRTVNQITIAQKWVPFSAPIFNEIATDLIDDYGRSELEAARILAYANAAAFDAIISCFDTKFAYWARRPTQVDPSIALAPGIGLPNHPSFPAAHSCETGAFQGVLADAFPKERASLAAIAQEAAMSRVYAGVHYRFDGNAGLATGLATAGLALRRGLE
jgi:membrane-associated phospholipid phosphatase